ncbi:MAG: WbqC family protein [Deltaproteobacteria bacterium]|nr:WbqC family protein [Deltaproteobacteria bacterium]
MIVSAYQPYFAPFPGFFAKAMHSDILVLMDGVQFPRGTSWLTRNRFKNDQGTFYVTVPVWKKGLGLQKITDVKICYERPWARKSLASLEASYARAPFFENHLEFLEDVFSDRFERLIDLNVEIIRHLMRHLQIPAKVVLLSELGIKATEPQLTLDVCRKLGASHFLAQRSAGKYLDPTIFKSAGIKLMFFNPRPPVYPQLWGAFIANLSVFDLLFNCGPAACDILKKQLGVSVD